MSDTELLPCPFCGAARATRCTPRASQEQGAAMIRKVILTLRAGSEADAHLLELATKGEPTTVQLRTADNVGYYSAHCVVMQAHSQTASDGSGTLERVYQLQVVDRG